MACVRFNLEYTQNAIRDLDRILHYIRVELDNVPAAEALYSDIYNAIDNACNFPRLAPLANYNVIYELRKMVVKNYVIFYGVDESAKKIKIYTIRYAKSDLSKIF